MRFSFKVLQGRTDISKYGNEEGERDLKTVDYCLWLNLAGLYTLKIRALKDEVFLQDVAGSYRFLSLEKGKGKIVGCKVVLKANIGRCGFVRESIHSEYCST